SRINMNLRETKGWSYGVRSILTTPLNNASLMLYAPVQADRTGDSMVELLKDMGAYTGEQGVTGEELTRMINGNVRELPGQFETSRDVLGGVRNIVTYERPDDYYEALASKYEGLTAEEINAKAREVLKSDDLVWVVVGDAESVRPQLDQLGLPVEVVKAAETEEAGE
ncbi:MAG: insulinase family protein, partial [Sphingomonadaceae bacterium]|nr:insulinase family protein [Sphingomonadaceae bacterium]